MVQHIFYLLYILLFLSFLIYLFLQRGRELYKLQDEEETIEHFSTSELWDFFKILLILVIIFLYVYENHGLYGILKVGREIVNFLLYIGKRLIQLGGKLIGMTKKSSSSQRTPVQSGSTKAQPGRWERIKTYSAEKYTTLKNKLPFKTKPTAQAATQNINPHTGKHTPIPTIFPQSSRSWWGGIRSY